MKRVSLATVLIAVILTILIVVQTAYLGQEVERTSLETDEEPRSGEPWELVFTVDGQWAIAITPYNGKLYLAERDYMNHTAYIYESDDGENFTKKFNTQSDQVFVMGVNPLNNTLYIGTLWRLGQGVGGLFYVDGANFGQFDTDVWWNSSSSNPAVPLSMHLYQNKFFVGGLSWTSVGESGNKMWVKYEDQNGDWYWTDMSSSRLGTVIEAYSLEEYDGKLYSGTFEPAKVVVYDEMSGMWFNSLTGVVDGVAVGNSGVVELINYSGKLHGLTWKYGCDWYYDGISWQGGNVSQYGGFGRAIVHNDTLYAGTTPFYSDDGIKPWTFSNISSYDGTSWTDEWLIDTILPMYFAEYDGYIYATAGRRVYRMNTNVPTPPITEPPRNLHARLTGPGHASVNITWDPSLQEEFVVNYTIYHSNTYRKDRQSYEVLAELPKGTTDFVHSLAGHGDPDNHFYYVQANGTNSSAESVTQVAKFSRDVSLGPQLISIPLEQQDTSLSAVLATINYDRVWTYDGNPGSGGWTSNITQKPWWSDGNLSFERGYWVDIASAGQFTVAGRVPVSTVLHLYAGWNMISFPSFENYDVDRVVMETGATRVEMCDPSNVPYRLMHITGSTTLAAGEGYWIFVPAGQNWTVT